MRSNTYLNKDMMEFYGELVEEIAEKREEASKKSGN